MTVNFGLGCRKVDSSELCGLGRNTNNFVDTVDTADTADTVDTADTADTDTTVPANLNLIHQPPAEYKQLEFLKFEEVAEFILLKAGFKQIQLGFS